jgi:hypothetical protein
MVVPAVTAPAIIRELEISNAPAGSGTRAEGVATTTVYYKNLQIT